MATTTDLADVIDKSALIENILCQVIETFCAPRKDRFGFFWSVILDSSIMPMGAKAKVAMAIAQEVKFKLDQNAIHNVMSLRNAFAHQPTNSHPVLVVGKTREEDEMHLQLQILSNSGKISMKRRQNALAEFNESYKDAKGSLVALLQAIKENGAKSTA